MSNNINYPLLPISLIEDCIFYQSKELAWAHLLGGCSLVSCFNRCGKKSIKAGSLHLQRSTDRQLIVSFLKQWKLIQVEICWSIQPQLTSTQSFRSWGEPIQACTPSVIPRGCICKGKDLEPFHTQICGALSVAFLHASANKLHFFTFPFISVCPP